MSEYVACPPLPVLSNVQCHTESTFDKEAKNLTRLDWTTEAAGEQIQKVNAEQIEVRLVDIDSHHRRASRSECYKW